MQKRNFNIDMLKFLAILSVIIIHSIDVETQNRFLGAYTIAQAVPLFIIIYGFNFYNSTVRKNLTLKEQYQPARLWEKTKRILFPFLAAFLTDFLIFRSSENLSLGQVWKSVMLGLEGRGPGSYYVVWLFTLIAVAPLFYQAIIRFPRLTVAMTFLISFAGEYLVSAHQILSDDMYRISPLRFLLPLVLGLYYGFKRPRLHAGWVTLALLSMFYILLVEYADMPSLAHRFWRSQTTLSFFYPFFLFMWFEPIKVRLSAKAQKRITAVSRTTYHIFLVQMCYFGTEISAWFEDKLTVPILYILVSLLVCVMLGGLFYRFEEKIYHLVGRGMGKGMVLR